MEPVKIVVINFGGTSSKVAYFENDRCLIKENIVHPVEAIRACRDVQEQYSFRKEAVLGFLEKYKIDIHTLDSITSRGGMTEPIVGGTYRINEAMVEEACSGEYGHHVSGVGCRIALDLCKESDHAVPLTTDTPTTDEMEPIARFSGLKEIERVACMQTLNTKATARHYAAQNGKRLEDITVVSVMMGSGIGTCAIKGGKMIDASDCLEGEGAFANDRCCTVPVGKLVRLCYSGKYDLKGMLRHINGEAGLISYLGTTNIREIVQRIEDGDEYARNVMEAMCYQVAKDVGAMATVLKGELDAIILTGGMANVPFITEHITERVKFIAPVVVIPGERELEALAEGSYRALKGDIPILEFIPQKRSDAV